MPLLEQLSWGPGDSDGRRVVVDDRLLYAAVHCVAAWWKARHAIIEADAEVGAAEGGIAAGRAAAERLLNTHLSDGGRHVWTLPAWCEAQRHSGSRGERKRARRLVGDRSSGIAAQHGRLRRLATNAARHHPTRKKATRQECN